jgi:hypothetical protein
MEISDVRALHRLSASRNEARSASSAATLWNEIKLRGFGGNIRLITQWPETSMSAVFQALVYPSHIELQGPIVPGDNSVTDGYRKSMNHFLRVKFVDNNSMPLKSEARVNVKNIVRQRVVRILRSHDQIQILSGIRMHHDFLGYSMSSLKKRKAVWFYRNVEHEKFLASQAEVVPGSSLPTLTGSKHDKPLKGGRTPHDQPATSSTSSYQKSNGKH